MIASSSGPPLILKEANPAAFEASCDYEHGYVWCVREQPEVGEQVIENGAVLSVRLKIMHPYGTQMGHPSHVNQTLCSATAYSLIVFQLKFSYFVV